MTDEVEDKYLFPVVQFVEYSPIGEILMVGSMAIGYLQDREAEGRNILYVDTVPSILTSRVDVASKTVEPKPECPAVLDGTTLTGIPIPSRVTTNNQTYTVDDGEFDMDIVTPGAYSIRVDNPIYKTGWYEVTV